MDHTTQDTSIKLCDCGCGRPAPIASATNRPRGHIKGQPIRFIRGHQGRKAITPCEPGLCECGCGQPTPLAKKTRSKERVRKGEPLHFLPGHHARLRTRPVEERFWEHVEKSAPDACWNWKLSTHDGYGYFYCATKQREVAHRFSYRLHYGEIPDGKLVCHHCDNRACVNPAHLFLGTIQDNTADKVKKGRQARGKQNNRAKLSEFDVREIRRRFANDGISQTALAIEYQVTSQQISSIVRNESWQHVT